MTSHEETEDSDAAAEEEQLDWPFCWRSGDQPKSALEDPKYIVFDALNQAGLLRPLEMTVLHYTGISVMTLLQRRWKHMPYMPTLIFRYVGRKTGRLLTKTIAYYPDGDDFILIGSLGGGPRDPEWVGNLLANPLAWVRCNRKEYVVHAHKAEGAERERLWGLVTQGTSYARYQERAWPREIPVMVLRPQKMEEREAPRMLNRNKIG
jgi:deazaflavin-dependent oxidoreductase (nitroreductase family)